MKLFILSVSFLFNCIFVIAQDPIKCEFAAKKINDLQYEINITAHVRVNWHIYSQFTPKGGPLPTKFTFQKNPLLLLTGKVEEEGELHQKYEEVFAVQTKYFDTKVVFKQLATLKKSIKTTFSGAVEYMVCNDTQCLSPTTETFNISL